MAQSAMDIPLTFFADFDNGTVCIHASIILGVLVV